MPSNSVSHRGVVTKVTDGELEVRILSKSACAACHIKSACNIAEMQEKIVILPKPEDSDFKDGDEVEVGVHPTLVPFTHMLSNVNDAFNAAMVKGDMSDYTMYYGRGAGRQPTASTVVGDIGDIARNLAHGETRYERGVPNYAEGKIKLRFTTNHDEAEKMSPVREFHGNQGSLAAFVATTYIHGGMLIYGCQEVAYPGTIHFFNYTPVDWSANRDMYNAYKDIVRVFKANSALRSGSMVPYPDNNILMFERKDASETVFVAINMRDNQNYIALPEQWKGKTVTDLFTGKTRTLSADRELLKPFEYIVVK